jgi:6-phosphogluconolactonase (cycloisomerase 2 family)
MLFPGLTRAKALAVAVLAATGLATVAAAALAAPASAAATTAHGPFPGPARHAVFVQTDNLTGNQVVAYKRSAAGRLTLAGTYNTGGRGGQLTGSAVDHLASQGSLQYDPRQRVLIAVNAGSNTVSVFWVFGDRLFLRQVVSSGGTFPVSVAIHDNLVYVVNALKGGSVQGYRLFFGHLFPVAGSSRALNLDPSATPQFTNTPGQVAFSRDGSQLIVTTKANGNDIDVFGVGSGGRLTASPVVNSEPGAVPFGITFDQSGHLVIADAGTNALSTFTLNSDGTVTPIDSVGTGQAATCWVTPARGALFASNAGSANISGYTSAASGHLTLLGQTATDPGTVDAAATPGGKFLYVQTGGNGIVDEFSVGSGGSLTSVGSVTVAGAAGGVGIAAG